MPDKPSTGGAFSPTVVRLLLAAVIILWGANWPVTKIGVEAMPPVWLANARLVLGALSRFALLALVGPLQLATRRDLPGVRRVGALQRGAFSAMVDRQSVEKGKRVSVRLE